MAFILGFFFALRQVRRKDDNAVQKSAEHYQILTFFRAWITFPFVLVFEVLTVDYIFVLQKGIICNIHYLI